MTKEIKTIQVEATDIDDLTKKEINSVITSLNDLKEKPFISTSEIDNLISILNAIKSRKRPHSLNL
jgi:hypothetical protein